MRVRTKLVMAFVVVILIIPLSIIVLYFAGIRLSDDTSLRQQIAALPVSSVHVYPTALSEFHRIGRADGLGWSVNPKDPANTHMNFGPYTSSIPRGPSIATFRLMIDDVTSPDKDLLVLDVVDAEANRTFAQVTLARHDFKQAKTYQDFDLPFEAPLHGRLEFRTFYLGIGYINQEKVTVRPDPNPRPFLLEFPTALSNSHRIGHADGLGWAIKPGEANNDFLNYGPYTNAVSPGRHIATFRLMIDNITDADANVVNLDVNDSLSNKVIAQLPVTRRQFKQPMVYQDFDLPFDAPRKSRLEFRTYYLGSCYVNQQNVIVTKPAAVTK